MVQRQRRASDIVHGSILVALSALAALPLASCGEFVPLGAPVDSDVEVPRATPQGAPCLFFESGEPFRCQPPTTRCSGPCCDGCRSKCSYQECDQLGKCHSYEGVCAASGQCVMPSDPTYCPDDSLR